MYISTFIFPCIIFGSENKIAWFIYFPQYKKNAEKVKTNNFSFLTQKLSPSRKNAQDRIGYSRFLDMGCKLLYILEIGCKLKFLALIKAWVLRNVFSIIGYLFFRYYALDKERRRRKITPNIFLRDSI